MQELEILIEELELYAGSEHTTIRISDIYLRLLEIKSSLNK
jgi:hypothetical protein